MAYFTKYRPDSFETMIGHQSVVSSVTEILAKAKREGSLPPKSWLFTGQSGIGKTTIARILGRALGAKPSGFIEQNSASIRGIDGVRSITKQTLFKSPGSPVTVVVLDECHKLTDDAQNALLKALEDPPKHVYYILCTTEPEKLIETVRQRCLQFRFNSLTPDETAALLWNVGEQENVNLTDEIVQAIIDRSNGSPRLTLNMLEKIEPVAPDYHKVLQLIDGMAQDTQVEGPSNLGLTIIDMMYGKQKCQWKDMVKFLNDRVLFKKEKIDDIKRALIYNFGKKLLYSPTDWLAKSAIKLECSINSPNTDGAFIGYMYEIWRDCPMTEAIPQTRSKPPMDQDGNTSPIKPPTFAGIRRPVASTKIM